MAIYRELGHRLGEANALSNKAVTFMGMSDYPAALESAQQALRLPGRKRIAARKRSYSITSEKFTDSCRNTSSRSIITNARWRSCARATGALGLTLGNLGVTYGDLGDLPRALDHFRQAIEISDEFSDRRTKSLLLESVGLIWQRLGETAKAFDALTQSLELARAVGDRQALGAALTSLGELYLLRGENERRAIRSRRRWNSRALQASRSWKPPLSGRWENLLWRTEIRRSDPSVSAITFVVSRSR